MVSLEVQTHTPTPTYVPYTLNCQHLERLHREQSYPQWWPALRTNQSDIRTYVRSTHPCLPPPSGQGYVDQPKPLQHTSLTVSCTSCDTGTDSCCRGLGPLRSRLFPLPPHQRNNDKPLYTDTHTYMYVHMYVTHVCSSNATSRRYVYHLHRL